MSFSIICKSSFLSCQQIKRLFVISHSGLPLPTLGGPSLEFYLSLSSQLLTWSISDFKLTFCCETAMSHCALKFPCKLIRRWEAIYIYLEYLGSLHKPQDACLNHCLVYLHANTTDTRMKGNCPNDLCTVCKPGVIDTLMNRNLKLFTAELALQAVIKVYSCCLEIGFRTGT